MTADSFNGHRVDRLPFAGLRVLLVDDESLVRYAVADMLESFGAAVEEAASSGNARDLLDEAEYGLVITDLVMPGMSGDGLAREIALRWPGLPVLIISGSGSDAEAALGWPCLAKPFLTADLATAIDAALARRFSGGEDSPD